MDFSSLAGGAASIAGGVIGNTASQGDRDQQMQAYKDALAAFQNIKAPTVEEMQIALQNYKNTGQLTPEMEALITQGSSQMGNISTDPRLQQAQMTALNSLLSQGQGGQNMNDQAMLDAIQRNGAQQEHSQESSILQNMQQRGVGGSGNELAARLSAAQNGANSTAAQGLNVGAQASNRALQALQAGGGMGAQMQAQSFGQQSQQAQAQDAINRFNAQNQQQVKHQNTGLNNQAQQYNLQNSQNLSNANTGLANQQEQYNKGLYQTVFNDQMQRAAGMQGGYGAIGNQYGNQANRTAQMWSGIGAGVNQMVGSQGGPSAASGGGYSGAAPSSAENNFASGNASSMLGSGATGGGPSLFSQGGMVGDEQHPQQYNGGGLVDTALQLAPLVAMMASDGGPVPGQASVPGDSPQNDTIHAMLSPGEIVIPRTIAHDPSKAKKFVELVHKLHTFHHGKK